MINRFMALIVACALGVAGACSPAPQDKTVATPVIADKQIIDATLSGFVERGDVAGVSALVYKGGEEAYFGAFGMADIEAGKPMTRDTLVQIYSMTKPVTGVALMTLYEQGKFDLDDPLEKYAPEFSGMKVYAGEDDNGAPILVDLERPITIRDITRHTAGFSGLGDQSGAAALMQKADPLNWENTLTEMAEKLGDVPLSFQPGAQWRYGPSVDVQAFLVERISGAPYGDYVREHVLDPLNMDDTAYYVPEAKRDRMAALYQVGDDLVRQPDEQVRALNYKHWAMTPGGFGLVGSIDDYMTFARMLENEGEIDGARILDRETVQLMATNHLSETVTDRSWLPSKGRVGFGIDFAVRTAPPAEDAENYGVVGEFFWDGYASTLFWVDPDNDLAAVLFVQFIPFNGVGFLKMFV